MAQIKGLKELNAQLKALGTAASGDILRKSAASAMLPVVKAAKANVPVGTEMHRTYKGRLVAPGFARRSIRRRSKLGRQKTKAWAWVGVEEEAFYAVQFLELGTSKMPKRPWLEPAFRSSRDEVIRRLGQRIKMSIEKAAKK